MVTINISTAARPGHGRHQALDLQHLGVAFGHRFGEELRHAPPGGRDVKDLVLHGFDVKNGHIYIYIYIYIINYGSYLVYIYG